MKTNDQVSEIKYFPERKAVTSLVPAEHEYTRLTEKKLWSSAWRKRLVVAAQLLLDALVALLVWEAAYLLQGVWGIWEISVGFATVVASGVAVWVGLRALMGLYPGYGLDAVEELRWHTHSALATLGIMTTFALGLGAGGVSLLLLVAVFVGSLLLAPPGRYLVRRVMRRFGIWGRLVVVLSYKDTGAQTTELLDEEWALGYDPVAVFNYRLKHSEDSYQAISSEETITEAVDLAHRQGVDTAIFAMPYTRREQLAALVDQASLSFRHVLVIPNLSGITNSAVVARNLSGTFAVEIKHNLLDPWALRLKRVFDLVATTIGAVLISPILLGIALLIYLESRGSILYRDRRMGQNGELFSCTKFRTMVPDAETVLHQMLQEDPELRDEYSKYHKLQKDPRITRVGSFLRRTSLDELPQLWDVLRGEMSLVGPRPYLSRESEDIGCARGEILRVPPGVTGPWQVAGRNSKSFDERVEMDSYYVRDWSVWLDVILLVRTVKVVLLSRGAY